MAIMETAMITFLCLNLTDSLLTWRAISQGGGELNWYRLLLSSMPLWEVLVLKMCLAGLLAFIVYKRRERLFKPLNTGMGIIAGFNLLLILTGMI